MRTHKKAKRHASGGHPDNKRVRGKPYLAEDCAVIQILLKAPRIVRENHSKRWTNTGAKILRKPC